MVTGSSRSIGDALTGHPLVRNVNFTGSVGVGRHVMKVAADNLTPVTPELGGNDAALVLEDAALNDEVFNKMYWGAFGSSGQICMAIKRLYVHESRYDEVVDGFDGGLRTRSGGRRPARNHHGAGQQRQAARVVTDMIAEARAKGAVRECGQVPDAELYNGGGYFQRPALVYNADPSLSVVKRRAVWSGDADHEVQHRSDVIALANDSEFGLCSSVWTEDAERAVGIAKQLEAGYTYLNGHGPMAQDGRGPFGGFKNSGIGRNMGYDGVLAFAEPHSISAPVGFLVD